MTDRSPRIVGAGETDVGLRNFMLGTYRWMAAAMAVTAAVAWFVGQAIHSSPELMGTLRNPFFILGYIIAIPVLFGTVGSRLQRMSMGGVLGFLFGMAAFFGLMMGHIAAFANPMAIAKIFFMTVAMFGALSLFGYTTERNLWTYAKYAFAAFFGYIAVMVLGMFIPALAPTGGVLMVIQILALAAIAVITAWETQFLKNVYYSVAGDVAMQNKLSAFGAASLLLSFVNMFKLLFSLFGSE